MRERNRTNFVRNKKQMKTKTIYLTLFVTAMFIFGSAVSAINLSSEPKELNEINEEQKNIYPVDGLAPKKLSTGMDTVSISQEIGINGENGHTVAQPFEGLMYGYCAALCPHGEGPCYWDTDDPTDIEQLSTQMLPNFAAGGTWTCDERWIVCDYANGALFEIDPETGDIGDGYGGGTALNGLAIDPTDQTLYGCSSTDLYTVNVDDGSQEYVGSLGTGQTHIGLAITEGGVMYTWDVKFSGDTYLYEVDKETGEATQLFSMGKTLCFAQDGDWNRAEGLLYLTAYIYSPEYGGYLCTVDVDAEEFTIIDQFESSAEICGSMFIQSCIPPEHDVALKSIDKPVDGYATNDMDVEVTIKNYGNNSEYTDVQFEIIKCEEGPALDSEYFDTFPPDGWTTDYWRQSNSNYAGGLAPEARVNKYYAPTSIRDNYIMSRPINATGFEKINVKFRLYLETYSSYGRYVYFYLEYRKNDTSPWRDASPWPNPVGETFGPDDFEIGCYGWGEDLGSEFQARWGISGTYYLYWNDVYLDDFEIYGCAGCAEYTDLQQDVFVDIDEEVVVEFEKWTPSEWQNPEYEDTWEEYPLSAYTTLEDNNSRNDKKIQLLSLYYPFLHDVGTFDMGGPETGPAQVFPVTGVIKNVGQYDECCFKTYCEIAEIDYETSTTIFTEDFGTSCYPWPPAGWTRTHTNSLCSYSTLPGGTAPCLYFYRYPLSYPATMRFHTTIPIDTSDYGAVELSWKQRNTYNYGSYELQVETSADGNSWDVVWGHTGTIGPETTTITTGENVGGEEFYISFTVDTPAYYGFYWYVDDILINGFPLKEPEFKEEYCVSELDVGEELEIDFGDWEPEFLDDLKNGQKTYKAQIWTDMQTPPDRQRSNDMYSIFLELDYFHDVGIQQVASPADDPRGDMWFAYNAYDPSGQLSEGPCTFDSEVPGEIALLKATSSGSFIAGADWVEGEWIGCEYNGGILWRIDPETGDMERIGGGGTGLNGLAYNDKTGKLYGAGSYALFEVDLETGSQSMIGSYTGASVLAIAIAIDNDGVCYLHDIVNDAIYLCDLETAQLSQLGSTGLMANYAQDMAYDRGNDAMYLAGYTTSGSLYEMDMDTGKATLIGGFQGGAEMTGFAIPGGGVYPLETYVAPGTYPIDVIAENIGTFPEYGLCATADIFEFITDCENATHTGYTDTITEIDIPAPLGGTETLEFDDFFFGDEGFYGLLVNLTCIENDVDMGNNVFQYGVGCDDTPPETDHTLDPADPDGLNGWYISDLEVTVTASDPSIGCEIEGSGVDYIVYEVDGDQGTIEGDTGVFTITQEDDNEDVLVEYWAVDNVGNEETHHTFTIDMDQTPPDIELTYEWAGTSPPWEFSFIANATDVTSGMERVEFYLNEGLQKVITDPGPEYIFTLLYVPPPSALWKATAFDFAGLNAFDTVKDPVRSKTLNVGSTEIGKTISIPQRI